VDGQLPAVFVQVRPSHSYYLNILHALLPGYGKVLSATQKKWNNSAIFWLNLTYKEVLKTTAACSVLITMSTFFVL
jgi:hypothetical protein